MPPRAATRAIVWVDRIRVLGLLMMAFALHQLFVTDLLQQRAQRSLREDFLATAQMMAPTVASPSAVVALPAATVPAAAAPNSSAVAPLESVLVSADTTAPTVVAEAAAPVGPSPAPPDRGDAVALIAIPAIGVDEAVVEGVEVADLRRAPGHVPGTPLPGQQGNAVIAGHRTTYGAPFGRLDGLVPGDEILVRTFGGGFVYTVSSSEIVRPDQVEVVENFGDDRLTLITCHPRYSARQRLVVTAHFTRFMNDDATPAPVAANDPSPASSAPTSLPPGSGSSNQPSVLPPSAEPPGDISGLGTPSVAAAGPVLAAPAAEALGAIDLGDTVGLLDDTSAMWPITGWGLLIAGLRRWSRGWSTRIGRPSMHLLTLPVVVVALVPWFEAISHALPSNY